MAAAIILKKRLMMKRRRRLDGEDHEEDDDADDQGNIFGIDENTTAADAANAILGGVYVSPRSRARQEELENSRNRFWRYQPQVYRFYNHPVVQGCVAVIIVCNFVLTIAEREIDAFPKEQKRYRDLWEGGDTTFNVIFLLELLLNMAGSGAGAFFWRNPWNVFDFIVVAVGMLSETGALEGNALSDLKMLRFFRVFRLFKRVKSLNKIVTALLKAIPGVMNAFVIMLIVMCIYAIVGVQYFRTFGENGTYTTEEAPTLDADGNPDYRTATASAITARNMHYGLEYYGTFSRSLYTLFQVLTGESWAEAIARPLIFGLNPRNAFAAALFFISFIVITSVVLVNVVIAVLLDQFVTDVPDADGDGGSEPPAQERAALAAEVSSLKSDLKSIDAQVSEVDAMRRKLTGILDAMQRR